MSDSAPPIPFLATVGLACERDRRLLFDQLELHLQPGDMLQVAGPNGSGKTSLLRLLAGLMPPTEGSVLLAGKPLAAQRTELARSLLWIGHAAGIKGLLSAEENLAWLGALNRCGSTSREAIWTALAEVGLRGFEDVPCHTLSAGQQRRVALARLYLAPPPLWILDEPFTALDKAGVAQVEIHLARHCEQGGMVVFTTHHSLTEKARNFRELDLGLRAA
ncbi:cytochrome c biogenesis heme-transporting ATPase CcmA [Azomonas macrocytogenes]|uniref:Heme exporter protein A n=1 Tax=Azomonas macrocytogenes TaxID=69962 RepID=A0A839SWP0_AZOMA|nr:cytochrome c biogenesis heme-transporting ATPase CcmA [Azomonas macrocytogenes]MBB3101807.1 heme exporter protein A [Azomonas macrocytogenes]